MEDVDEKLLPGWSAEYIDASALPRVSPVCEEADGVCCAEEEFVAAEAVVEADGPPAVRDDSASAAAVGFGEEPWLLALAPAAVPPLPPLLGAEEGATVPLLVLPVAAALPPLPPLLFWEE